MTWFKIDGLRDAHHALVAAEAGAAFLGFVFVHGVRRQLTEQDAREIIDDYRKQHGAGGPKLLGLFANQPIEEVNRIVKTCGLGYVQLCGDEPPEYWKQVVVPVIKQIKVDTRRPEDEAVGDALRRVEEVLAAGHKALLDSYEPGHLGGTGRTFDWAVARRIAEGHEVILAGGLTPENVAEAIATVRPWGVDVSSGVEADGVKDDAKIRAFAKAVLAKS
ncbi:MAG: phosphoribosylanthranilate isomerase [Chloroflexi bacterium]|nr:phosphoribosylanthranilate isomerase [Chloroflexota bacterium]